MNHDALEPNTYERATMSTMTIGDIIQRLQDEDPEKLVATLMIYDGKLYINPL